MQGENQLNHDKHTEIFGYLDMHVFIHIHGACQNVLNVAINSWCEIFNEYERTTKFI